MHRQVLLQVFLLVLLFTLADSWFFRRRRRSYRPVTRPPTQNTKATKIWESARSKVGWTKWSLANSWNGDTNYENKWKCNLFVYDVLLEAKAKIPTRWSWSNWSRGPIGANEWANPKSGYVSDTNCYEVVDYSNREKGDVIAFKRENGSGHMGIVSTYGNYISALREKVQEDNIDAFLQNDASIENKPGTVWRYKC